MRYFHIKVAEEDPSSAELVVGSESDLTHAPAGDIDEDATAAVEKLLEGREIDFDPIAENLYTFGIEQKSIVTNLLISNGWRQGTRADDDDDEE